MVREPRALVGLNKPVFSSSDVRDDQVKADNRDIDRASCLDRCRNEVVMDLVRDIVDGAAGVEVGRAPDEKLSASRRNGVHLIPAQPDATLRLSIERDLRFTTRCGCSAPALFLDQITHTVLPRPNDLRRPAYGRCNDLEANHDDAEIMPGNVLLKQHGVAMPTRL